MPEHTPGPNGARLRIAEATAAGITELLGAEAPAAVEAAAIVGEWRRGLADGADPEALARLGGRLAELDAAAHPEPEADPDDGPARRIVVTRAADIEPVPVTWTWEDRIPAAMFSLCAGREGTGKSTALLERAARLTRGDLPGQYHGTPRSVVIVAAEDSWAHTIVPRLMAAGADLGRVLRVTVVIRDLGTTGELSLPDDLGALAEVIRREDVALVILDPLVSRLSRRLDTHRDAEVRQALEPLARLADESGAAVVGIIHVSKAMTRDPLTAVMGSRGFVATARAVLFAAQEPEDRSRRVLSLVKCNVGPDDTGGVESLGYSIEPAEIETRHGSAQTARIVWTGPADRGAREIHAAGDGGTREAAYARTEAETWLRELLADGPVPVTDVQAAAKRDRIAWRTLERAKAALGVQARRQGFGPGAAYSWRLPPHGPPPRPIDRQDKVVGGPWADVADHGGEAPEPPPEDPDPPGERGETPAREPGSDDDDPAPTAAPDARRDPAPSADPRRRCRHCGYRRLTGLRLRRVAPRGDGGACVNCRTPWPPDDPVPSIAAPDPDRGAL